jgi:hypothetical protein
MPLLDMSPQSDQDLKSIRIRNIGLGAAIIKKADFWRKTGLEGPEATNFSLVQAKTNNVASLFDDELRDVEWDTAVDLTPGRAIPAGSELVLVKMTLSRLQEQLRTKRKHERKCECCQEDAVRLLINWGEQQKEMMVRIQYKDIYGNAMPALTQF